MSLDRFFDKTVKSQKKAHSTGAAVEVWVDVSTSVKCCIPPTSPADAVAFGSMKLRFNITHQMFCWATEDIKVDYQIVDGSDKYIVRVQPKKWGNFYQIYLSEVK